MPWAPLAPRPAESAEASRFRRAFLISTAGHLLFLLIVVVAPFIVRWVTRPPKREIVTFVELVPPPPPAPPVTRPEPPKPQPPSPKKEEPKPSPIPEKPPEKPRPEKPKIQVSTNRIVRPAEPRPPRPQQPALTPEQIRKLLEANIRFNPASPPAATIDDLSLYYAIVRDAMYAAWIQPSAVARGLRAEASIRVLRNGAVTQRRLTRPSGNRLMDDSVMQALNSVSMLRPLPPEIREPHLDITIEFVVGE
ncbi:MAG: TonB C-terminal domain-containing protein [Kiritimatiellae bacterium]|nr:TonB C-terminal domain-containing protein [Kiritimatiellia bacterium]MDW8458564.1 energy transducer TonB [Verrucomicrobiota bacterium]